MNTVAKGNSFENRVFNVIKAELFSERMGILPNSCRIYRKKKYYSKNRKANIEIDISIEVFLPNMKNWSILWAIECKDYNGSLPVSDVEEFHAKVQQIAGDNVKATLVLSGTWQRSAFEYCKSMGIGIARLLPHNEISSFVAAPLSFYSPRRKQMEIDETIQAPTESNLEDSYNFYAFQDNRFHENWCSLIEATLLRVAN